MSIPLSYNGWTNREAWVVNMWLNAEPSSYETLQRIGRQYHNRSDCAEAVERIVQDELAAIRDDSSSGETCQVPRSGESTGTRSPKA